VGRLYIASSHYFNILNLKFNQNYNSNPLPDKFILP
jgi:hypothetical protein